MSKLFFVTSTAGHGETFFGIGFRTPEALHTQEEAQAKADKLNEVWEKLDEQVKRDTLRLSRVRNVDGFWVAPVDRFNDLTPAEMLTGQPLKERRGPLTMYQQSMLDKPFSVRFPLVLEEIGAPDPATIIS